MIAASYCPLKRMMDGRVPNVVEHPVCRRLHSPKQRTPMNQVVTSHAFVKAIGTAFGLPKNMVSFQMRVVAGEAVSIVAEYYPSLDLLDVSKVFENFALVPLDRPLTKKLDFDAWLNDRKEAAHKAYMAHIAAMGNVRGNAG